MVGDADDVAGIGFIHSRAVLRHEGDGVVDRQQLAGGDLLDFHAAFETARAHPQEGDTVAVLGIHVGLDLEHESGELGFVRCHRARRGLARQRCRREVDHGIEQGLHAEVVDGGAEIDRCLLAGKVGVLVETV